MIIYEKSKKEKERERGEIKKGRRELTVIMKRAREKKREKEEATT